MGSYYRNPLGRLAFPPTSEITESCYVLFWRIQRLQAPFKYPILASRHPIKAINLKICLDCDEATAEWLKKLKNEYACESWKELLLLALSALENKGLPPEVHLVAAKKGEPIEEDEQALLWRNICATQRRIDSFHVKSPRDYEVVTKMTAELRKLISEYHKKSYTQNEELRKEMQSLLEHLKSEKAQIELERKRIEYENKPNIIFSTEPL